MKNINRFDGSQVNDGINTNTYDLLFKDYYNLPKEECNSKENLIPLLTIDKFTLCEKKNLLIKLKRLIDKSEGIDVSRIQFDEESKRYKYVDENNEIFFNMISKICETNNNVIDELTSNKRYGKCHSGIISIAPNVPNSYVVTGYITVANRKVLHSILEYKVDDKTIVLDWTRNITIEKNDYDRLTKFEEISRFKGKLVKEDLKLIKGFNLGCKAYVTFRDEIISDLEKKKYLYRK